VSTSRLLLPLCALSLLAPACRAPAQAPTPEEPVVVTESVDGWQVIGRSRAGLPLRARTHGAGPRRIYLIAGIHGDERPAVENAARLRLLVETSLPRGVTVRLVEDVNPDGTRAGTRGNGRGVDLNRNWPARTFTPDKSRGPAPLSEPEAAAVHGDLLRFDPSLVIVLHSARRGPFVNFDGPARQPSEAFVAAAAKVDPDWRVVSDMGYATPGSLGSWMGEDRQVPILTVELRRETTAEEAWPGLRAGMLAVLGSSRGQ
jgi:murein peptide amidase A